MVPERGFTWEASQEGTCYKRGTGREGSSGSVARRWTLEVIRLLPDYTKTGAHNTAFFSFRLKAIDVLFFFLFF